ncbi:HD domain-containing protein [Actinoplanes sp. CA-054009]
MIRPLVADARDLAERVLADLPERWQHSVGVAERATQISATVSAEEADVLVAAAWLHDIGYAEALRDTGFHPLDGARHLRRLRWPMRIAGLVAHHSGAICVAHVKGLEGALAEFPQENTPVSDGLTYADQTVGPYGRSMDFEDRMADMLRRHGPGSPNAAVHSRRAPMLRAAVQRVVSRLSIPAGVRVA